MSNGNNGKTKAASDLAQSPEARLKGGIIYSEDIEAVLICMNIAMQRWKKDKKKYKDVSTGGVLREHGYQIVSKANKVVEDIINIRSFIPRYIRILKKTKKSDKEIKQIKMIINDFISKFKIQRIN